jgi:hypothetical protein
VENVLSDYLHLIDKYDSAYLFCDKKCIMVNDLDEPIYVDAGHLTRTGAQRLIPVFDKVFININSLRVETP